MSETVKAGNEQEMFESFLKLFPEFSSKCPGYRVFQWNDRVRKILISISDTPTNILFSVRKDEDTDTWDQFSALLIPAGHMEG